MPDINAGESPFTAAIDYLRAKRRVPTQHWTDLWHTEHAVGFAVASATAADLLKDLHEAVQQALAQGQDIKDFRPEFERIVQAHGWTGWTGETTAKGRAWRARVIWDTNLRSAFAAGHWAGIEATKDDFPYLRYSAVLDSRTRPQHAAWHGTILPVDHPWWQTHFPPNGWYCRCQAIPVSERQLRRRGWQVSPDPAVTTRREYVGGGRGYVDVPDGIDPGFAWTPRSDAARWQDARARRIEAEAAIGQPVPPSLPESLPEPPRADAESTAVGPTPPIVRQITPVRTTKGVRWRFDDRGPTPQPGEVWLTDRGWRRVVGRTVLDRGYDGESVAYRLKAIAAATAAPEYERQEAARRARGKDAMARMMWS